MRVRDTTVVPRAAEARRVGRTAWPIALAACLAGGCGRAASSTASPDAARPNVLLVTVDTFRADRLGAGIAPALDGLAAGHLQFNGEIAYADAQIARVLAWLHARSLADRTVIIVAGDHGESLNEHGERTHGMLLYDSTLRVPLIVAAPGRAAARRTDPVSLADVAPTIQRAAGVTAPAAMTGRDLLGPVGPNAAAGGRGGAWRPPGVYSETDYPRVAGWSPLQALSDGRWKTIRAGALSEVYDLQNDPAEAHDLGTTETWLAAPGARALRDEAARAERAALVLAPDSAASHNGLGLIAVDDGRSGDAVSEFERATAIDPRDASYWVNLGNARRARHDAAAAGQAYRRALDVDPGAADAANGVGVLLVEANRARDAAPWFERAIAAAPDFVEARLNLGIALQQAGDTQRAAESYRAVLSAAGGHSPEKQAAARLLAALGAVR